MSTARFSGSYYNSGEPNERIEPLLRQLKEFSPESTSLSTDLRSLEASQKIVEVAERKFQRIDVLMNCIGMVIPGSLETLSEEQIQEVVNTNILSTINGVKAVLPMMRRQESGHIIAAYKHVNKFFYSWWNIFRRWLKFPTLQSVQEPLPQFPLKLVVTTFLFFKVSIFQRHHAQKRVFLALQSRERPVKRRELQEEELQEAAAYSLTASN